MPNDDFNNEDDFLNTDENERFQDINNEDAAKFNADEFERSVIERNRNKEKGTGSAGEQARFNNAEQEKAVNQRERDEAANKNVSGQSPADPDR